MKTIKIRHLALTLMCVSSLLWSTLRAATYTVTVDNINYTVDSTTGEATCYGPTSKSLTKKNVVILDKVSYNGTDYPVTSIRNYAFQSCSGFTGSLTIPNSVTSIGDGAFWGCSGFNSLLTIGENVWSIGSYAFYKCSGFTGSLTIPNSVQTIGNKAFYECGGFTGSLTIGENVQSIGEDAFYKCTGFTGSLTIPNSVSSIGNDAFSGCSGFTDSLTIGENVQLIGNYAFFGCSGLTGSLTIPNSVTSIGDYAFWGCSGLTGSLTIPNSVQSIGNSAFWGCSGFTGSLTIGENVQSIGEEAFYGCSGFTGSLTIPNSVQSIENDAFRNCSGFNGALTIPNSVQSIGERAFYGCSGFTGSLIIPNSVTSIGTNAFYDCKGFTGSLTIGENVRSIGSAAFYKCSGLTGSLTIPNSVTSIGVSAFYDCKGFTGSLTIGENVQSIGEHAFDSCSGLTGSLIIPNSVQSVGSYAFAYGPKFTDVTIGENVQSLGYENAGYVFLFCYNLQWVKCLGTKPPVAYKANFSKYNIPLYVPTESINAYKNAFDWKDFTNILPLPVLATGVELSKTTASLLIGQNYTLTATVLPEDATDKTIVWSSDAEGVATVDQDGKVTALSVGTANITATCGEVSATCVVTVKTLTSDDVTVTPGTGTTDGDEDSSAADNTDKGGSLQGNDLTLRVGQTASVNLNVAIESDVAPEFEWSLATDGEELVKMTVAEVTLSASFTGLAIGETTYSVKLANTDTELVSGKVKVIAATPIESLTLEPAELTMAQNALPVQLTAKINPENASVTALTWTSSDEKVATVSADGKVTPVAQGTATITATTTDGTALSATCTVTVTDPIDDNFGFEFDESVVGGADGITLYIGGTYTFVPKSREGYVLPEIKDWSSSDAETVSVDQTGKIAALKVGQATVTATAEVNGQPVTSSCLVNVIPIPASSVTISAEDATLLVGQSYTLTAEVEPADATDKTITWSSDAEGIATVDQEGKVTAVSVGTANITATCGEATATCVVTVKTLTSDDVTVTPGTGTTEGDEDGSAADNTQNGGSLQGNDLTLRVGQTAGIELEVNIDLTVAPVFVWTLAEGGDNYVTMSVGNDTVSADFTGVARGETSYNISVEGMDNVLVTGKVTVFDPNASGVEGVATESNGDIEVYNLQGMRMNVSDRDDLNSLPTGVYIVNGTKIRL